MGPPSNPSALIEYVLSNFIKGAGLQKGSRPGFAHAMKLSYNTIDKQRLSVQGEKHSLTYRYRLSTDVPNYTVGLLTALMDELSTDACYRVGLPSAPGLSLQMQTELTPGGGALLATTTKEVDIINVVTKLGRTISHTRTDFRCAKTNELMAVSSHVKYMPTGSRFLDLVFNNFHLSELYRWLFVKNAQVPFYEETPLVKDVLQSHLEYHGVDRATFHVTPEHTNPFGGMHGGCHAMVMEQVGETYAKDQLKCEAVVLESIQIDYLGAGKGSMEVVCETIGSTSINPDEGGTILVRVLLKRGERTSSEGKLRLSAVKSRL